MGGRVPGRREAAEEGRWWVVMPKSLGAGTDYAKPAPYRKKSVTWAVRMTVPFRIETLEGVMDGKAGDYLAIGVHGELYPIDYNIFMETYEADDGHE